MKHQTTATPNKKEIVFKCKQCSFVATIQSDTGEMKVVDMGDIKAKHGGMYSALPGLGVSEIVVGPSTNDPARDN